MALRQSGFTASPGLSWFTGAHRESLDETSTARTFYSALGAWTFMCSLLAGLMCMLAVSYATGAESAWDYWWVAIVWTAVMVCLERVVLQAAGDSWRGLLAYGTIRVGVTLLAALIVGELAALGMFSRDIDGELSLEQLSALRQAHHQVDEIYLPKIKDLEGDIARLQANERRVERRISHSQLQAERATSSDVGDYYRQRASDDREQLAQMNTRNHGRFADERDQLARLEIDYRNALENREKSIRQHDGLLARTKALEVLRKADSDVNRFAWLFRLLFIALDLTAFAAVWARHLQKEEPYKINKRSREAQEALAGLQRIADAETRAAEIKDYSRARRRRNKRRADQEEFDRFGDSEPARSDSTDSSGAPIEAYSLSEFTEQMQPWESRPVDVPDDLRRGGLLGLVVACLTLTLAYALDVSGWPLAALVVILVLSHFAYTRGFHRTASWGLPAIFLALIAGLALPVLLIAINV